MINGVSQAKGFQERVSTVEKGEEDTERKSFSEGLQSDIEGEIKSAFIKNIFLLGLFFFFILFV